MLVPKHPNSTPHRRSRLPLPGLSLFNLILFGLLASPPLQAKGPAVPQRIPLDSLGFQSLSPQFLLSGSSMLTLHYVDGQHLLITFNARHLMTRLPDEPEDDMDRNVDAVLLELPSGHVLARTTWRLHDHGQYLWSLGHGQFILRVRDSLTLFAPLANLASGQPFAERKFLNSVDRTIATILLSPDADLLIVESRKRTPPAPKPVTPLFGPTPHQTELIERDRAPIQVNFYRLLWQDGTVIPRSAGRVVTRSTGMIPATASGYLAIVDQGRQHWAFDFHSYTGKVDELAPLDSTCTPAPLFVSHSEFIAFACHEGQGLHVLGGFNMRGQEMWEQNLYGEYLAPSLVFAPASGRFAFSRILAHSTLVPDQPVSSDEIQSQSVVVYQTGSGKQILRAECSPVERAGQNFALAPDGLSLAVVHADAIEIYALPALTSKEQADLKLAEASAPPPNDIPVHFGSESAQAIEADSSTPDNPSSTPATTEADPAGDRTSLHPPAAQPDPPPAASQASGDSLPEQPRKPPTLYTLPTDKVPNANSPRTDPQ
jgi:hypothetical protein